MARFEGHQPDVDFDPPIDDVASPPVAPASPSPTLPDEIPLANQTTTRPIGSSFSDLGAASNGMVRPAVDASLQNASGGGGQAVGSIAHHTNDLAVMQNNLLAEVNAGQFSGAALGHVQAILSNLTSAISTANAAASSFGSAAGAEQAIRASQLSIINTISTDPVLANPAPAAPLPTGSAPIAAPHSFAEIGAIFDDVASQILGGVNDDNRQQITDDINAVITDMEALIGANPEMFSGLTGVHADAVLRQLQLELTYINDPNISPDAAQASSDNILDIIDLIQGDANLADMATQDGISGFSPLPDAPNPTPIHLDNEAQTVFLANFISQSNSLGQQAIDLVGSGDTKAIATLIDDLKAFEKYVTDFDAAHGGNELLGAEIAAMIKGLQTGNATLVTAAADQMQGNAADVGGNNVPVTGGAYNTDGVTIAEVLGTPAVAAAPASQPVVTVSVEPVAVAAADLAVGVDYDHSPAPELAHDLHHMWG
jgi:hypothetical protein